jgi:hypothetical protein
MSLVNRAQFCIQWMDMRQMNKHTRAVEVLQWQCTAAIAVYSGVPYCDTNLWSVGAWKQGQCETGVPRCASWEKQIEFWPSFSIIMLQSQTPCLTPSIKLNWQCACIHGWLLPVLQYTGVCVCVPVRAGIGLCSDVINAESFFYSERKELHWAPSINTVYPNCSAWACLAPEREHTLSWEWAYVELSVGMPWAERKQTLSWGWAYLHWNCVVLEVNTYVLEEHAASVFRVELRRCSWGHFAWKAITWSDPSEWEKTESGQGCNLTTCLSCSLHLWRWRQDLSPKL